MSGARLFTSVAAMFVKTRVKFCDHFLKVHTSFYVQKFNPMAALDLEAEEDPNCLKIRPSIFGLFLLICRLS